MFPRTLRYMTVGLVGLLVIGFLGPVPARAMPPAQTTPLSQIARTLDGNISVRLPQGWMAQTTAGSVFTSALALGDSAASLQDVQNSLSGGLTDAGLTRMNGAIAIVNSQLTAGLSSDVAINSLLQGIIQNQTALGGQVVEQQSLMLGGTYPASLVVISNQAQNASGFVAVFQTQLGIAEATIGASPALNFQNNRQLLLDILNSVRIPGEAAENLPAQTGGAAQAQPQTGQAQPNQTQPGVAGLASIRVPAGWASQQATVEGFSEVTAFGNTQANLQAILGLIINGTEISTFQGIAGILGVVDLSQAGGADPATLVQPLMQQLLISIQGEDVQIVTQPQAHTFGGQYAGQLALTSLGYLGVLSGGGQVAVVMLLTDALEANQAQFEGLLDTIRIPAEAQAEGDQPANEQPAGVQTGMGGLLTGSATVPTLATYRNPDGMLSFALPEGWVTLDFVAAQNVLAFGDSNAAATSRLASARADLAAALPLTGQGGLIILYGMADLGIDPASPDLAPLMAQVIAGAQGQGYQVIEGAQPLPGLGSGGQIALIAGNEAGYVVLAAFGDQVAYVTATSMPADFEASRDLLHQIAQSVRIPAEEESSQPQGSGGLGGLLPPASSN